MTDQPSRARLPITAARPELLPARAHADDAGLDLCAADAHRLAPGERALVDTGLTLALPAGTVGLVCPRSGLAAKHGITVLNAPGIIDAGYRGPVKVALINLDADHDFSIAPGDRIAQLVITPISPVSIDHVDTLDAGDTRGVGGFGSSGGFGAAASGDESASSAPGSSEGE